MAPKPTASKKSPKYFVYILKSKDKTLYTGITTDLEKRFNTHRNGKGGSYTRAHPPQKIIYTETHPNRSSALKREYEIKSWPREKKLKLVLKKERPAR